MFALISRLLFVLMNNSPAHFFKHRLRVGEVREEARRCLVIFWAAGTFLSACSQLQTLISRLLLRISLNGFFLLFRSYLPFCGLEKFRGTPSTHRSRRQWVGSQIVRNWPILVEYSLYICLWLVSFPRLKIPRSSIDLFACLFRVACFNTFQYAPIIALTDSNALDRVNRSYDRSM